MLFFKLYYIVMSNSYDPAKRSFADKGNFDYLQTEPKYTSDADKAEVDFNKHEETCVKYVIAYIIGFFIWCVAWAAVFQFQWKWSKNTDTDLSKKYAIFVMGLGGAMFIALSTFTYKRCMKNANRNYQLAMDRSIVQ